MHFSLKIEKTGTDKFEIRPLRSVIFLTEIYLDPLCLIYENRFPILYDWKPFDVILNKIEISFCRYLGLNCVITGWWARAILLMYKVLFVRDKLSPELKFQHSFYGNITANSNFIGKNITLLTRNIFFLSVS